MAPLRLVITKKSVRAYIATGILLLPEQWDGYRQIVIAHPRKQALNNRIMALKVDVDGIVAQLTKEKNMALMTAAKVRDLVMAELHPEDMPPADTPFSCFEQVINSKEGRTRQLYEVTLRRLVAYCPGFRSVPFEDITVRWLEDFDRFMARTSPSRNARNIHFRNLRCVFNRAIDDELTHCYPFRRFKLRPEPTVKRAMSVEEIRKIATAPLPEWQEQYRDMWVLMFCLIGINVADLCSLKEIDGMGRIQYIRRKTHKAYSVKVEPEAMRIIERYRGKDYLLNMMDGHKGYRNWYQQLVHGLSAVRDSLNGIEDGVRLKALTSYWARHSWATCAARLDIPKETIAAALGHGGNTVTDIYIDFDRRKVDEANRRVLDFVFGG